MFVNASAVPEKNAGKCYVLMYMDDQQVEKIPEISAVESSLREKRLCDGSNSDAAQEAAESTRRGQTRIINAVDEVGSRNAC